MCIRDSDYTVDKIPQEYRDSVYVYTDDDFFLARCKEKKVNYVERKEALDSESTREMIQGFLKNTNTISEEILMLYLTYPNRSWSQVTAALRIFREEKVKSLLCKKEADTHPYLCMYENPQNTGTPVVEHDYYRRQDYPKCFEISHQICIFNSEEISNLNKNIYNENTRYLLVNDVVDVDYESDLKKVEGYDY